MIFKFGYFFGFLDPFRLPDKIKHREIHLHVESRIEKSVKKNFIKCSLDRNLFMAHNVVPWVSTGLSNICSRIQL